MDGAMQVNVAYARKAVSPAEAGAPLFTSAHSQV